MEKEVEEKYIKAGKIARVVRNYACELIQPGAFAVDIAEKAEKKILMLNNI